MMNIVFYKAILMSTVNIFNILEEHIKVPMIKKILLRHHLEVMNDFKAIQRGSSNRFAKKRRNRKFLIGELKNLALQND